MKIRCNARSLCSLCLATLIIVSTVTAGASTPLVQSSKTSTETNTVESATTQSGENRTVVVRFQDIPQTDSNASENISERKDRVASVQAPLVSLAETNKHVQVDHSFWIVNAALVTVDTAQYSLDSLRTLDNVTGVHRNIQVRNNHTDISNRFGTVASSSSDEAESNRQYAQGVQQINADQVWNQHANRGNNVTVAVLDSGVDPNHSAIDITQEHWAEFDSEGALVDSEPYDDSGHGTHVSGKVVGSNSNGTTVGVAPNATLLHGKVLNEYGTGSFARVVAGMEWAIEMDADIISLSFGTTQKSQYFIEPVRNAEENGVLVVGAVGNSGVTTSDSPANVFETVAVGAVNENGTVPAFSGGETIDSNLQWLNAPADWPESYVVPSVVAPGTEIMSTAAGGGYTNLTGTSMATPHVAGVGALLIAATNSTLRPVHIRERFATTADTPANVSATPTRYGHGIINATAVVNSPNTPVGDAELPPRDSDYDGLYEDIDSDGNVTLADVEMLFTEDNSTVIEQNPENFDFDADGNVSVGDVQALYDRNVSSDT